MKLKSLLKETFALQEAKSKEELAAELQKAFKAGPAATRAFLDSEDGKSDIVRKDLLLNPQTDGSMSDDTVKVGSAAGAAMDFKPTQSEIDLMKSVSWPLGSAENLIEAISSGPVAKGIVTSGDLIIDGHHRWSGAIAIGGNKAQIVGKDVNWPGTNTQEKLAAAQIAIAANLGPGKSIPSQSKPFKTNIMGQNADGIAKMIMDNVNKKTDPNAPGALLNDKMIKDLVAGEVSGAETVYDWLGGKPFEDKSSNKGYKLRMAIAKKVGENLAALPSNADAPERKDMPQFDPSVGGPKIDAVTGNLGGKGVGDYNVAAPFTKTESKQYKMKTKIQEAKETLKIKRVARIISESEYQKQMRILEDEEVMGTTDVVPLSKVNKDIAQAAIMQKGGVPGQKDNDAKDDAVSSNTPTIPVKDLKPAQTEIIKEKAFGMAIGMLQAGKWDGLDLQSIVSNDNYIMDGHHRWAAVFLIDPNASLKVTQIDLPGKALVTALNYVTAAKGTPGNVGKGNVAEFTGDKIGAVIDKAMKEGVKGDFPVAPEKVKEALGKVPGADGDAAKGKEIMMKNADALPKEIMPGAPERVNMPVILPKQVKAVAALLAKGAFDIKAPYSPDVKDKLQQDHINKRIDIQLFESVLKRSLKEFSKVSKRKK